MAKKYLLYIHDVRFEKEKKKSELVNRLLEGFYGQLDDGFGRLEDVGKPRELKITGIPDLVVAKNIKQNPDGTLSPVKLGRPASFMSMPIPVIKPCKHGADPKFCKYAKNGKVCK